MILNVLRYTNSTIDKQLALQMYTTDSDKEMFQLAYNPDQMFNLKFSSINWYTVKEFSLEDKALLGLILHGYISGNAARNAVENHCIVYGDLVKLICNKDLDCGVTATTLNKVFGKGFIPTFEVQLAEEVEISKVKCPIVGQLKYNGTRVIALIEPDRVIFKTRNGKIFKFPQLEKDLLNLSHYTDKPLMIDGELCFGDSQGTNHAKVSGIVNSSIKGTPIKDNLGLVYNVFDCLLLEEFSKQKCNKEYKDRFSELKGLVKLLNSDIISIADTFVFKTNEAIQEQFEKVLANGYEGFILKTWEHKYTFKRSKDWIKVKAIKSADLLCSNITEGKGKYSGMIGTLDCQGFVEGKQVCVSVGSGLSDMQRGLNVNEFIGKTVEVKYNTLIQDSLTGNWSLFLPRFVITREDKDLPESEKIVSMC